MPHFPVQLFHCTIFHGPFVFSALFFIYVWNRLLDDLFCSVLFIVFLSTLIQAAPESGDEADDLKALACRCFPLPRWWWCSCSQQLGYWFPGLPDFKIPAGAGCRGFVSRHRAPRDWHYTGCRCCWWSLVVADWCWWFEAIAISFYGGVIYEPARTMVYLERRLTIAPQQYLWVARVLDSFFMCWQYRFLTGWPKTNCVPFIKRIPKRTLNLAVFVLDVPVLLCLCVCACLFKVFSATMGCNPQVHEPKLMTWISIIDTLMTLQGWWCSGFTLVI